MSSINSICRLLRVLRFRSHAARTIMPPAAVYVENISSCNIQYERRGFRLPRKNDTTQGDLHIAVTAPSVQGLTETRSVASVPGMVSGSASAIGGRRGNGLKYLKLSMIGIASTKAPLSISSRNNTYPRKAATSGSRSSLTKT